MNKKFSIHLFCMRIVIIYCKNLIETEIIEVTEYNRNIYRSFTWNRKLDVNQVNLKYYLNNSKVKKCFSVILFHVIEFQKVNRPLIKSKKYFPFLDHNPTLLSSITNLRAEILHLDSKSK